MKLRFNLNDVLPVRYSGLEVVRSYNRDDGHAVVVQLRCPPGIAGDSVSILLSTEACIELATCDCCACGADVDYSVCVTDLAYHKARRKSTFITYVRKGRLIWRDFAPEYGQRMHRAVELRSRTRLSPGEAAAFAGITSEFDISGEDWGL